MQNSTTVTARATQNGCKSAPVCGKLPAPLRRFSMRRSLICFFALALLCAGVARSQTAAQSSATVAVIRAGTLIDGTSDKPRKNQLIFVRGGRIEKVTDT